MNPRRRPTLSIARAAGTVQIAMPTTMDATGSVAHEGEGARDPVNPARKTTRFRIPHQHHNHLRLRHTGHNRDNNLNGPPDADRPVVGFDRYQCREPAGPVDRSTRFRIHRQHHNHLRHRGHNRGNNLNEQAVDHFSLRYITVKLIYSFFFESR